MTKKIGGIGSGKNDQKGRAMGFTMALAGLIVPSTVNGQYGRY